MALLELNCYSSGKEIHFQPDFLKQKQKKTLDTSHLVIAYVNKPSLKLVET